MTECMDLAAMKKCIDLAAVDMGMGMGMGMGMAAGKHPRSHLTSGTWRPHTH